MSYKGKMPWEGLATSLQERLTNMSVPPEVLAKVNNSWQRNKENSVTISNLGNFTAEKSFIVNQSDWKNTGNVEQLDIGIPVEGSFSGLIRVTYTSFWGGSDSHGGATVLYRIGNYLAPASATILNDCVVETITPDFAKDFYIHKAVANTENGNIALLISRSPVANNPLVVKIELQGYFGGSKRAFQVLNDMVINISDMGSPTYNGYPWTPQTSRIPTGTDFSNWNSAAHRLQPKCAVVSDWNMVKDNGFYMGEPVALNAPTKEWWMGFVVAHNDSYVVQKLISVTGDSEFERQCNNGVWGNWLETSPRKLFQSVSDGKTALASAISDRGVYTSPVETFPNMANNIRLIPGKNTIITSASTPTNYQFTYVDASAGNIVAMYVTFTLPFKARNILISLVRGGAENYETRYLVNHETWGAHTCLLSTYNGGRLTTNTSHIRAVYSVSGGNHTYIIPVSGSGTHMIYAVQE